MQLFANTTSPYARIARIALAEKGVGEVELIVVDPWADDPRLREANTATRVPTLVTGRGPVLTESLLIAMWLEATRPPPAQPSLLGDDPTATLSRAGIAMGTIDAAVHTLIGRRITSPSFDETPVGVRRRRSMAEGLSRLEQIAQTTPFKTDRPALDAIAAVVALDYIRFRFPDVAWLPALPHLDRLSATLRARPSFDTTTPR